MRLAIVVLSCALAAPAHAGELEWSIGGGAARTASVQGDDGKDALLATGVRVTGRYRFVIAGVTGSLEVSEALGLRLGGVLGAERLLAARTRLMLLAESGIHSVTAQPDARTVLPYIGVRLGIDRWRSPQGGRSHGIWLAWQQDVQHATATHTYEVCSILGPCRDEKNTYELGGWAVMVVYRLAVVSR